MFTNGGLVAPAKLQISALKRLVSDEEAAQEEGLLQGPPHLDCLSSLGLEFQPSNYGVSLVTSPIRPF